MDTLILHFSALFPPLLTLEEKKKQRQGTDTLLTPKFFYMPAKLMVNLKLLATDDSPLEHIYIWCPQFNCGNYCLICRLF